MNGKDKNKTILLLSIPLIFLVIINSIYGLFNQAAYAKETINWTAQAVGQDAVDLFLVAPLLIITSFRAYKNNKPSILLWGGVVFYLTYSFVIYCFAVHFSSMFLFYCLTLGLSFYSSLYFIFTQIKNPIVKEYNSKIPVKASGFYLIILSCIFYLLWLSEVIPAMVTNITPKDITEIGLPINPVHSIDLSVCLPGIFLTGFWLLKQNPFGLFLSPAVLMFTILMNITIGSLTFFMRMKGIEADFTLTFIMIFFTLISSFLLYLLLRSFNFSKKKF